MFHSCDAPPRSINRLRMILISVTVRIDPGLFLDRIGREGTGQTKNPGVGPDWLHPGLRTTVRATAGGHGRKKGVGSPPCRVLDIKFQGQFPVPVLGSE
jgi:hypothetical protein